MSADTAIPAFRDPDANDDPLTAVCVRYRTVCAKGTLPHRTAPLMVFKPVMAAAKTWRS